MSCYVSIESICLFYSWKRLLNLCYYLLHFPGPGTNEFEPSAILVLSLNDHFCFTKVDGS